MRHGVKKSKLGRDRDHRRAMLKNLATSILSKGLSADQNTRHVKTTLAKAKAVRSLVDRLITYAKNDGLPAKRLAARHVQDKETFKGLFSTLGPRYQNRHGGYTRILKLSANRHGDNAEICLISLVEDEVKFKSKKKKANVSKPASEKKVETPVNTENKEEKASSDSEEKKETEDLEVNSDSKDNFETSATKE